MNQAKFYISCICVIQIETLTRHTSDCGANRLISTNISVYIRPSRTRGRLALAYIRTHGRKDTIKIDYNHKLDGIG